MDTGLPAAEVRPGTDDDAPVLLFVHGAMDRGASWDRVRRRITRFTTVAYDRRGYASSVHLPFGDDPFADHVADLRSLTRAVGEGRPVVLVGHSAGSNVVLAVAQVEPGVVASVVYEPPMPWTDWWPSTAGGSTLAVHAEHGPEAAAEAFMRRIIGDAIWERLPSTTRDARRSEGSALYADLSTLRGRPVQFDHAAIGIPVVVGRGERSIPHHRRSSEETAALLANAELVDLSGQAHGGHNSDPAGFVGLIERALARFPD